MKRFVCSRLNRDSEWEWEWKSECAVASCLLWLPMAIAPWIAINCMNLLCLVVATTPPSPPPHRHIHHFYKVKERKQTNIHSQRAKEIKKPKEKERGSKREEEAHELSHQVTWTSNNPWHWICRKAERMESTLMRLTFQSGSLVDFVVSHSMRWHSPAEHTAVVLYWSSISMCAILLRQTCRTEWASNTYNAEHTFMFRNGILYWRTKRT